MSSITASLQQGITQSGIPAGRVSIVSDIPFKPQAAAALGVDFFHVPRGRTIAFGSGLKLANPTLRVLSVVGDLMTIGGNHFVHASRRNMELAVICINNFVYRKISSQPAPVRPAGFAPYSTFEEPFNIPHLGNSCGAVYTARWTAGHTEELARSISDVLKKQGLSLVEVLAPGPTYYTDIDSIDTDLVNFYHENSVVKNDEDPRRVGIVPHDKIAVGRFTNRERPTFIDVYNAQLGKVLGSKFTPYDQAS